MKLIFSDNPSVISWKVQEALEEGFDLCAAPFVLAGHFCQWVEREEAIHEYKLISAFLPSEFEHEVLKYHAEGWELYTKPVDWNGAAFQWMCRLKGSVLTVERFLPAARVVAVSEPVLNMVESVTKIGRFSFLDFSLGGAA